VCKTCNIEYLAISEFFHRNKGRKNGFNNKCKDCRKESLKEKRENSIHPILGYYWSNYVRDGVGEKSNLSYSFDAKIRSSSGQSFNIVSHCQYRYQIDNDEYIMPNTLRNDFKNKVGKIINITKRMEDSFSDKLKIRLGKHYDTPIYRFIIEMKRESDILNMKNNYRSQLRVVIKNAMPSYDFIDSDCTVKEQYVMKLSAFSTYIRRRHYCGSVYVYVFDERYSSCKVPIYVWSWFGGVLFSKIGYTEERENTSYLRNSINAWFKLNPSIMSLSEDNRYLDVYNSLCEV
jgi:hypothetical protein